MPTQPDTAPHLTREELRDDLRRLGLGDGSIVVVHASLSGLGWVEGGADAVIDALLDTVGQHGTLLFPTLTGSERDGPEQPPVVHLRETPCWTGHIPETARQRADARRSWHPTHSVVAFGAQTEAFVAGHETSATPCDEHGPWGKLIEHDGQILLLGGVTQQSNTTLHALEEQGEVPYHLHSDTTDGVVIDEEGRRHIVRNRLHQWGWQRDFRKLDDLLLEEGVMRCGAVGASASCLISAGKLARVVLPILQRDPLYLLASEARARYESTDLQR